LIIDNQQTIIADDTVPSTVSEVGGADRAPHMNALMGKTV
jgi:hypothetical protein